MCSWAPPITSLCLSLLFIPGMTYESWGSCNKVPKMGGEGLQTTDIYSLTVLEARCLRLRCGQGWLPPKPLGEDPSCLLQLLGLQGFLGLWPRASSLCLPLHLAFSSSVGQISRVSLLTLVVRFRVHLDNPGWSPRKILNHICKDHLPNKVTSTTSGDQDTDIRLGSTFQSTTLTKAQK